MTARGPRSEEPTVQTRAVTVQPYAGRIAGEVVLAFERPVCWLKMTPRQARAVARLLTTYATEAEQHERPAPNHGTTCPCPGCKPRHKGGCLCARCSLRGRRGQVEGADGQ